MDEWLNNLKVGDEVIVSGGGIDNRIFRSTVERLTKTLIITKGGMKFRRRDGHSPGQWSTGLLREPTLENLEQVREHSLEIMRRSLAHKLRVYAWHKLPLETLEKIHESLPKTP